MNGTVAHFPRIALEGSIPDRFAEQVARHPDRLAIRAGETSLTYGELGRAVDRITEAFLARTGPAAQAIALLFDQGIPLVAATMGVLSAGKYYLPLDPTHPPMRLATMLEDAQPVLIVTDGPHWDLATALTGDPDRVLDLDRIASAPASMVPRPVVAPDALAYIYYTSGSTGQPKGVLDTHRNVLHNVMRYTNTLHITADDRITLVGPPSCSGTVSDVFSALLNGAALFPVDVHRDGLNGLAAWMERERLTIHHSTPAIFRHIALSTDSLPSLRVIRLEGDRASPRDVELYRARCAANAVLVNGLGLTECGLVRQYFVDREAPVGAVVPVGYPVEDMVVAVVDATGRDVPSGTVGEVVVESRYLALGYRGRPDLTSNRFVDVPDRPGARRYRTGDLGRLGVDGCLEYLGRADLQPKVRGNRVDVEEIEAALLELSTLRDVAVTVRADDPDQPQLFAYCVPCAFPPPTVSALRAHLAERLPRDLLPSAYVWLEQLPLSDNGKVDHRALPPPGRARPVLATPYVAPRTALEMQIARLYTEVLAIDDIGVDDSFFDLGGDSLQATQLVARLRECYDVELGVRTLLEAASVATLTATVLSQRPRAASGAWDSRRP